MDWTPAVAGGVSGLGAGIVGSLVAPWVQLAVEKRRDKQAHRRELVRQWRALVARHLQHAPSSRALLTDPDYLTVRQHLSAEVVSQLERPTDNTLRAVGGVSGIRAHKDLDLLTREVDRIERGWKLV